MQRNEYLAIRPSMAEIYVLEQIQELPNYLSLLKLYAKTFR
jgi:hypothetical protein